MNPPKHAERMLLVAYQCGPGLGSVSQLGWQWFCGLAMRHQVCLVTHIRNRSAIETALRQLPNQPGALLTRSPRTARLLFIDTEWFAGPLYRLARRLFPRSDHAVFMISQLDWFLFDALSLRALRREMAAGARWQLLHLVTPITTAAPTRLHRLGLPVVRGPLNCGLGIPPGFPTVMRDDAMGLSRLRVLPRILEAWFGSLRNSAAVLVATAATRDSLPKEARTSSIQMLENAVDPDVFSPHDDPGSSKPGAAIRGPLRISFVGRLVPFKALPLLLEAMAQLRAGGVPVQLEVVGEGPMAPSWRDCAQRLGLTDCVAWLGSRDADGVADVMRRSHVFCLPSVRESGGAVFLEAMACSRPVIGMDFGGPAEILDSEIGWKIPMPDEPTAIAGLVRALREAYQHPEEAARRGVQGRKRVLERYTWEAKFRAVDALYTQLVQDLSPEIRC